MKKILHYGLLLSLFTFSCLSGLKSANITILYDAAYVDNSGSCGGDDVDNLRLTLINQGHTVTTFTGSSTVDLTAALVGQDAIFIPELISGNWLGDLQTNGGATEITNFVTNGGGLIKIAEQTGGNRSSDIFLNTLFGFSIVQNCCTLGNASLNPAEAAGTPFAGGPAMLNFELFTVPFTTLPLGTKCIYDVDGSPGQTVVNLIPAGAGNILYLGWDWRFGGPGCSAEDANWNQVLNSAALATLPPPPVPTLGQWGLIILSLLMMSIVMVFSMAPKMATTNGQTIPTKVTLQNFAFDKNTFFKTWGGVALATVLGFVTAMNVFGYELTSADPIGAFVASGIVAFMITKMKK